VNNFTYLSFQIDTNMINARQVNDNMNKLEKWHNEGVIEIIISEIASSEAKQDTDHKRTKKANSYIYSMTFAETPEEKHKIYEIANIVFPNGITSQNQKNDVEIIFNAYKYGRVLVTNDGASKRQPGGILGNAIKLAKLGVKVMTDREAVQLVEDKIQRLKDYCQIKQANSNKPDCTANNNETKAYKGFLITPGPFQLAESGRWTLEISITKHRDEIGETRIIKFSASNTFGTKKEAIQHCLYFGKQIIDGELENLTVDDLLT
jgi:hypothetical protein